MIYLIPALCLTLFAGWLAAEFRAERKVRIALGILVFGCSSLLAIFLGALERLNSNAYFGAADDFVTAAILRLERGDTNRVLQVFRGFKAQYQPTYENRANFQKLATEAAERLGSDDSIKHGSVWDGSPYDQTRWKGHWEDGTGYWIVVHDSMPTYDIYRSGDPPLKMHDVSVTPDFRELRFKEGSNWLHTLTLTHKHAASHEWFNLEKRSVWQVDTLHKLVRKGED